jgi:AcrR family transcriptional regulator
MPAATLVPTAPAASGFSAQELRVIEGALRCIARWGVAKTTLDDVAREAGISRATLYRVFPGGKELLLAAVASRELARFFGAIERRLAAAADLEDMLVAAMAEAIDQLHAHEALRFLLRHEPELVVPHVSFSRLDRVLSAAGDLLGPHLRRWLAEDDALRAAEWLARLVLSYAAAPMPDVPPAGEEHITRLVRAFVLPGLAPVTDLTVVSTTIHHVGGSTT